MSPNVTLYLALALYAAGTLLALVSLIGQGERLQRIALGAMLGGFVSHTVWIGTICVKTGHPPITNLPETTSFLAWTIFFVEVIVFLKYRVQAASFFVYPLVLILLTLTAVVHEPFAKMDPSLRSGLFITHIFLTILGLAGLLIGLAFTLLSAYQDRALKSKSRGVLYEWIPSLSVCNFVSYRALAIGFSIYTFGIIAGVLWSYRTTAGLVSFRAKEIGAMMAWMLFAALLQSYVTGSRRSTRNIVVSVLAFAAIVIAIMGIRHA
jgi:ABC-type uncharacterized transport system permease subunit